MTDIERGDTGGPGDGSGITRRTLVKRGAIVGGTVLWAAPVVQSFTSPAFGQVGTGKDLSYLAFFYDCGQGPRGVKIELNDNGTVAACEASADPDTPGCTLTPPAGATAGDCGKFIVTVNAGVVSVTFKEADACTFIDSAAVGKCGNPTNPASGGACVQGRAVGNTLTFGLCVG